MDDAYHQDRTDNKRQSTMNKLAEESHENMTVIKIEENILCICHVELIKRTLLNEFGYENGL